ncbi:MULTISPECIES: DUF2285 domain-containing protein [Rhodomicrobium]|uniref:DUF2285 domain-containing protein n=1 Tax=Rhodomicrobium vannielii TaxID=1069 RepID=UPI000B4B6F84
MRGRSAPFADPNQASHEARPIWSAEAGAPVLIARAAAIAGPDTSEAALFAPDLPGAVHLLIDDRKRSHLLLVCGPLALQLLIEGADLLSGPVSLNFITRGIAELAPAIDKLSMLRRILACSSQFRHAQRSWSTQTLRLRNALIALDGHAAGASYREIATVIFGKERVARDWPDPSLKDRVRRSLSRGQAYINGRYRTLIF